VFNIARSNLKFKKVFKIKPNQPIKELRYQACYWVYKYMMDNK
jgi:hypothetical protein